MKPAVFVGLAGLVLGAVMISRKRRKKKTVVEKIQGRAEDVLGDLEHRVAELRDEAKRLSGEARGKLQDQAHDLESQQKDLRKRLNDLSGEAQKLLEKAKSRAHA